MSAATRESAPEPVVEAIAGGVTSPLGFRAAGVACGIKRDGLDLALVVSDRPASAAGVFTTNRVQAAPVTRARANLQHSGGRAQAVVINSGCANACTGDAGDEAARLMVDRTAEAVGCSPDHVLVASTGVIGVPLDTARVAAGILKAVAALGSRHVDAARAIMTTDRGPKEAAARIVLPQGTIRVGGMAKGAGMIEPRLATMLAVVTTDAEVPPALLHRALVEAVRDTFNAITVDGECSTNDSVFALASGASGVRIDEESIPLLTRGLRHVCRVLATKIVRDGEGATKLVTVTVTGAASDEEARRTARAIGNSLLVKTAIHGGDPNWGRLLAVAGRSDVAFDPSRAVVKIGPAVLYADGRPHNEREQEAAHHLEGQEVSVSVDLGTGGAAAATMWTCDLTAEYVRINADYRT